MNFKDLLTSAKQQDNDAQIALLEMYKPMLVKASIIDGCFDEDLYQEQCIILLQCIRNFVI